MKTNGRRAAANECDLDRKEWDFGQIPKRELESCLIYEYLREFVRSKRGLTAADGSATSRARTRFTALMRYYFAGPRSIRSKWSPDKAWVDLDSALRQELVERSSVLLDYITLTMMTLRQLEPLGVSTLEEFRRRHLYLHQQPGMLAQTEYGLFAVNWLFSDSEIVETFTRWLSTQRKEVQKRGWNPIRKKGRGGALDRLNCLGALRIMNHYSTSQLVDYDNPKLKIHGLPYQYLPDLRRAAKKARQELENYRH